MMVISSVWIQDGRYTVAIGTHVQRVPVSHETAEQILNEAKSFMAIRNESLVRGGGYVWFIDSRSFKGLNLSVYLNPDELAAAEKIEQRQRAERPRQRQGSYDKQNRDSNSTRGGQGNGPAHLDH
jgi:hypothetical protein